MATLLLGAWSLAGCASYESYQGVNTPFEDENIPVWVRGESTRGDVLDQLGPPSQIIALNGGSVFYYLRERGQGTAKVFIIYNTGEKTVEYDRAVFFFNENEVLTDFSFC